MLPSRKTTRWQGMTPGSGLRWSAKPTPRAVPREGGDVPVAHHPPGGDCSHDFVDTAREVGHCAMCAEAYCFIAPAPAYFSKWSPSVTTSVGACFTPYFMASSAFSSALSFS